MQNVIRKEFIIKGLHCANCAREIEESVKEVFGVSNAHIDFIGKRLILEYANPFDGENIVKQLISIIDNIEQGAKIIEKQDAGSNEVEGKEVIRSRIIKLTLSLLLFTIAFLFRTRGLIRLFFFWNSLHLIRRGSSFKSC